MIRLHVSLTEPQLEALRSEAKSRDTSIAALVRQVVENLVEQSNREAAIADAMEVVGAYR